MGVLAVNAARTRRAARARTRERRHGHVGIAKRHSGRDSVGGGPGVDPRLRSRTAPDLVASPLAADGDRSPLVLVRNGRGSAGPTRPPARHSVSIEARLRRPARLDSAARPGLHAWRQRGAVDALRAGARRASRAGAYAGTVDAVAHARGRAPLLVALHAGTGCTGNGIRDRTGPRDSIRRSRRVRPDGLPPPLFSPHPRTGPKRRVVSPSVFRIKPNGIRQRPARHAACDGLHGDADASRRVVYDPGR